MNQQLVTKIKGGILGSVLSLMLATLVSAKMGISSRFPDLVFEKVKPGTVYNIREVKGIPYVVINNSSEPMDIEILSQLPPSGGLKEGYEEIPDTEWVRVIPNEFRLEPGELAASDIILSIPNDPDLVGRHFQGRIQAKTKDVGFLSVAVANTVRFSIGTRGPEALAQEARREALMDLDVKLDPQSIRLMNVPLGKKIDIMKFKRKSLKVVNQGNSKVKLKFSSVPVDPTLKHPQYEVAPDPSWLTVKPTMMKVKPNRISETKLYLTIPNSPEHRGKKYMFLVKAELIGVDIPLELYSRVYVHTKK